MIAQLHAIGDPWLGDHMLRPSTESCQEDHSMGITRALATNTYVLSLVSDLTCLSSLPELVLLQCRWCALLFNELCLILVNLSFKR